MLLYLFKDMGCIVKKQSPINDELTRVWEKRSWSGRGTIPGHAIKKFRQDSRRPNAAHGHIFKLHTQYVHSMYTVLPEVLSHISCSPQLETVRRKGSKVGYFWTIDPSGTCAKAVCCCLSQRQHGVRWQVKPCGCDWRSQLWKISFSNFQTLKAIENFANVHLSGN
jgi:hypothetical protein